MQPILANSSELQKRVVVGFFGAVVMISLVALGGWVGICLTATLISMGMISESIVSTTVAGIAQTLRVVGYDCNPSEALSVAWRKLEGLKQG